MRTIHIANEKKRDAQVGFEMNKPKSKVVYKTRSGEDFANARYLKSTVETSAEKLAEKYPVVSKMAAMLSTGMDSALKNGDPEVDMEMVGRKLEDLQKVYLTADEKVAHNVTMTEHIYGTDGVEKSTRPVTETESNINLDDLPIRWTGKMFPKEDAMRKFVFLRSYQIKHVNGLTFDFLYDMAKKLDESHSLMLVGGGEKGVAPLVMQGNGTPYRAFLEGRVKDDKYALILHLTNLEIKALA